MDIKALNCLVRGHRWQRERRPNDTEILTCRRCGAVEVEKHDIDHPTNPFSSGSPGVGPLR